MKLIPTILSGGSGSRLWPVSRLSRPKPFIKLADGESLLQKAFLRAAHLADVVEIMTVTNRELFFQTEDELRPVNTAHCSTRFVLEPFGRNTAAACVAASLEVKRVHGGNALLLVLAADHLITDSDAFHAAVASACALAVQGNLVTFGITPTGPETGFGYIETNGNKALRMVEKPSFEKAQEYVAAGNYFWNAGMFCFTADTLLSEMALHAPEVVHATQKALEHAQRTAGQATERVELLAEQFAAVPDISIDYALMERTKNLAVVPCSIGWTDVGSWNAIGELCAPTDTAGNRVEGEAVLYDTRNCFIQSATRMVGCAGVENLLIVDTPDALLVASRDSAQDVKHLFTELKARAHEASSTHQMTHRPWGTYTVLEQGDGFKIKRIEVKPGGQLSLQSHAQRSEHWVVVSGAAQVVNGDTELTVLANQSTYISAGTKHRLSNVTEQMLVMIEIQTGDYLGEDDITRFDDVYGRIKVA